jgi:nucleoside-diphosphate-sugar epimerase
MDYPRKIMVTGSSGFIGSSLCEALHSSGYEVIYYDLTDGRDIFNDWLLRFHMRECDSVVHLAGSTVVPLSNLVPHDYYRVNTEGSARVFRAATEMKKKVIFASTGEVYIKNSHYAASKIGAEAAAHAEIIQRGGDIVILRFMNPYGYGQPESYLIPKFIKLVKSENPLTIHGNGEQRKDYIWVEDLAKAIITSLDFPSGTIADVGTGVTHSINDIVSIIEKLHGKPVEKIYIPSENREGELPEMKADTKLLKEYNWKPEVSFDEGIQRIWEML